MGDSTFWNGSLLWKDDLGCTINASIYRNCPYAVFLDVEEGTFLTVNK